MSGRAVVIYSLRPNIYRLSTGKDRAVLSSGDKVRAKARDHF